MKQNVSTASQIQLKAYSIKEVAEFYGICERTMMERTMKTWLIPYQKEIGPRMGRFYTPKQVKVIFEKLGIPQILELT
jgi:hypothetical protein